MHVSNLNPFLDFALEEFYDSDKRMKDENRALFFFSLIDLIYFFFFKDERLLLLLATCDCPAQRQVTGERAPGSEFGCEKCHQCAWRPEKQKDLDHQVRKIFMSYVCIDEHGVGSCSKRKCECSHAWP